jgi:retron-type reverse transcriptase
VVQAAVKMVMEPIFENRFAKHSYGFRPGRGCKDVLQRVDELLGAGNTHIVDVDIKGYFDSIPHDKLMALVREHIADGRVWGSSKASSDKARWKEQNSPKQWTKNHPKDRKIPEKARRKAES